MNWNTNSEAVTFIQVGGYLISSSENLGLEGHYLKPGLLLFNDEVIKSQDLLFQCHSRTFD